jgi:hypothetical protein
MLGHLVEEFVLFPLTLGPALRPQVDRGAEHEDETDHASDDGRAGFDLLRHRILLD